jgi:hypothetical protein
MNGGPSELGSLSAQLRYVYNSYRTALLNRKYYGYRLLLHQRYNFAMEIAIAVGATGSAGVASLAIWGTLTGHYAWLVVSGLATVLGVVKPILNMSAAVERYSKLYAGYGGLYLDLKSIVEDIEVSRSIPSGILQRYADIRKKTNELSGLDDPKPSRAKIKELQVEVNEEIPPEGLWLPPEEGAIGFEPGRKSPEKIKASHEVHNS